MNGVRVAKKSKSDIWADAIGSLLGEAAGLFLGAYLIMLVLGAIFPWLGAGYLTIAGALFCLSVATGVAFAQRFEGIKKAIREPHQLAQRPATQNVHVTNYEDAQRQVDRAGRQHAQATSQTGRR